MKDVELPSRGQDREGLTSRKANRDSSTIPWLNGARLEKFILFCETCPGVNYVYDVLFDEAPDPQSVKELLNLFALIATLFLGSAYGLLGSVTFGELQDADERWLNQSYPVEFSPQYEGNYYAGLYYSNTLVIKQEAPYLNTPSMRLGYNLNYAISLLQGAIYTIILVYMDVLAKDFNTNSGRYNFIAFEKWWFYARAPILGIIIILILSLWGIYAVFNYVYMIKFPNYCSYFPKIANPFFSTSDQNCTYQFNLSIQYQGLWIPLILGFSVLSFGVMAHYKNFREYQKHFEEWPSQIYDILEEVVITDEGKLNGGYIKKWEEKVLRSYIQSFKDNCIDYEDLKHADDQLLQTLNVNVYKHRKKIL